MGIAGEMRAWEVPECGVGHRDTAELNPACCSSEGYLEELPVLTKVSSRAEFSLWLEHKENH